MGESTKTVYVDTILGHAFRRPGVVRTDFAVSRLDQKDSEPTLHLVMPLDVARDYATALQKVVDGATEGGEASDEGPLTMFNLATMGLLVLGLRSFALDLGQLVVDHPDLAERYAEIERRTLQNSRNAVTEGVSINDEAPAMYASLETLKQLFAQIRGEGVDGDEPD